MSRWNAGKRHILAGVVATFALSTGSAAFAQCTSVATGPGAPFFAPQLNAATAAAGASAGAFGSALGNLQTAFLSQQGSAFVSAPGDPKPDQPGGGVWARGVGGEFTSKFSNSGTGTVTSGPGTIFVGGFPFAPIPAGALNTQAQANCTGSVHATFGGTQVGTDISRLNINGFNIHLGTTAGYLSSEARDNSGGTTSFDVPFLGTYLVATKGRFFADIMVRTEWYSANLTNAAVGLWNQQVGARGLSVATSAGYNFALDNNWFIEPSAGFIWSRTNVDAFNVSGGLISQGAVGTLVTAPIESQIGRLGVRVGTSIASGNMIWQPFVSANVFHEFAGNITSTGNSLTNGAFGQFCIVPGICGAAPLTLTGTNSTSRVGTYGQYSVGLAGQVANTGWLGYARIDYKNGQNLEGWTANAGIRYQFTPDTLAKPIGVFKAPVKALPPVVMAVNWTGVYAGGFFGAEVGKTDIRFVGDPAGNGANTRVQGAMAGIQAGYNYQAPGSKWVLGVEGDVGAVNLHGSRSCGTDNGRDANGNLVGTGFSPAFLTCQNTASWVATATARVGYAWDRTLLYVRAGGAWANDNVNIGCIFGPQNGVVQPAGVLGPCRNQVGAPTNGFATFGNHAGWLIGYGAEFALTNNWSAKAEYNYIDFGTRTALANDGTSTLRDSTTVAQVKIGVNYRFAPGGAVVAKY